MPIVSSRLQLIQYCLRKLGFPVVEINIDDDQIEDRIDDAFQYYYDYHSDGVERTFWAHQITQEDIDNGYAPIPDDMIFVTRALPFGRNGDSIYPMGDRNASWNFSFSSAFGGTPVSSGSYGNLANSHSTHAGGSNGMSMTSFYLSMTYFQDMKKLFGGYDELPIRFNRHTNRAFVDMDWATQSPGIGKYLMFEGYRIVNPDEHNDLYNDRWVKRYATALLKKQWGENMKKFSGIQLAGGVTMNGEQIFNEALAEIEKLEDEMQTMYEEPPAFFMG